MNSTQNTDAGTRIESDESARTASRPNHEPETAPSGPDVRTQPFANGPKAVPGGPEASPAGSEPIHTRPDPVSTDPAIDLGEYLKGRSVLDQLPADQQIAIIELLNDHAAHVVAEVLQQPPPVGLSLRTSKTSLNKFRRRYNAALAAHDKNHNKKALEDQIKCAAESDDAFQELAETFLKTRLLNCFTTPIFSPETVTQLVNALGKLRRKT